MKVKNLKFQPILIVTLTVIVIVIVGCEKNKTLEGNEQEWVEIIVPIPNIVSVTSMDSSNTVFEVRWAPINDARAVCEVYAVRADVINVSIILGETVSSHKLSVLIEDANYFGRGTLYKFYMRAYVIDYDISRNRVYFSEFSEPVFVSIP